jgi:hypothetical protein
MVKRAGTAFLLIALLTVAGIAPATAASGHRHRHRPPSSGVRGQVTAGPVCPVEMVPPDPSCNDRPVPARLTLQRGDFGSVVARGVAGNDGMFVIKVAPGRYTLSASSPNAMSCSPQPVTVAAGQFTDVHVDCDTGIR